MADYRNEPWVLRPTEADEARYVADQIERSKARKAAIQKQRAFETSHTILAGWTFRLRIAKEKPLVGFALATQEAIDDATEEWALWKKGGPRPTGLPKGLRPRPATAWDHLRAALRLLTARFFPGA